MARRGWDRRAEGLPRAASWGAHGARGCPLNRPPLSPCPRCSPQRELDRRDERIRKLELQLRGAYRCAAVMHSCAFLRGPLGAL